MLGLQTNHGVLLLRKCHEYGRKIVVELDVTKTFQLFLQIISTQANSRTYGKSIKNGL